MSSTHTAHQNCNSMGLGMRLVCQSDSTFWVAYVGQLLQLSAKGISYIFSRDDRLVISSHQVGGDSDWVLEGEDSPILLLRDSLNHEKQRRVASREKMVLDGDIPLKDVVLIRGPMSRQASEVFQPQSGFRHALEYIDYGALFYRNYFLGQG